MLGSGSSSFCQNIFLRSRNNPSGRMMPVEYFMFTEMHFGGCGCFSNTNTIHETVIAANIGFR
ncbi:hypothetical protein CAPTEDRAFT_227156 [Capitella teleta]|nr:hypothetical protein CAPTEDRAFT_227156 [Capitella teleta]|eukprot:ELT88519.1 hypothetical protein CAPTEDRAFT_227156 [Capitella teleta]